MSRVQAARGIALAAVSLLLGCRSTPPANPVSAGAAPQIGAQTFVRDGVRMWYRVAGNTKAGSPPVVFLHGGPGQGSAHFDALAGPWLEPSLRMVYFDQRGSGHSDRPSGRDYAIPTLVADLEALREALGAPQIVLVGHSFGGLLALEYAAQHPEQVAGLVVVSGVWDFPFQCRLRLQTLATLRPAAYARVRADTLGADGTRRSDCELEFQAFAGGGDRDAFNTQMMFPDPAIEARIDSVNAAHAIRNTGEMGQALFGNGLLGYRFAAFDRLTMPAVVIAGRHDGAARPEGLRELARRLPRARFVEYEQSGHFVYLDEPERFARELTRFVSAL